MSQHQDRGVTLIELVISISVIAITAFVLHPILTEGMRTWQHVEENTQFTSEANAVWLYLGPLLAHDAHITVAEETQMTFTAGGNTYRLSTLEHDNTNTLTLTQNGGTPQTLASPLAPLGLEIRYYAQDGQLTNTPNAITRIDIGLSLQGKTKTHPFRSFLRVEGETLEMGGAL